MGTILNLTGQKFGALTARVCFQDKKGRARWLCSCECGNLWTVSRQALHAGQQSCGCRTADISRRRHTTHGMHDTVEYNLLTSAKWRAKRDGVPFNLDIYDIQIPDICPLLGTPIKKIKNGKLAADSPSLDRVKPNLGYVKGNVRVVSFRANAIKNDASVDELKTLVGNLEKING